MAPFASTRAGHGQGDDSRRRMRRSRRTAAPRARLARDRRKRVAADLASGLDLCWRVELDVCPDADERTQ